MRCLENDMRQRSNIHFPKARRKLKAQRSFIKFCTSERYLAAGIGIACVPTELTSFGAELGIFYREDGVMAELWIGNVEGRHDGRQDYGVLLSL